MPQSSHVCVPQVVRGRSPSAAFGGVVVAVLQGVVAAAAEPIPGNDSPPHPPVILSRPDDVATLAAGFGLPAGFAAMLFAAEPDVANPVAIAVDRPGRCYVAETFSFGKQVATTSGVDPAAAVAADVSTVSIDDRLHWTERLLGEQAAAWKVHDERVRLLLDDDHDGRADRATVFAAGFNGLLDGHGSGVLARADDVFFACVPAVWRLRDVDADGVADERKPLHVGFGVREGLRGHDLHALVLGPDGRLYFSLGDRGFHLAGPNGVLADPEVGAVFRCEPDGSKLEVVATGLRNPQGLAFDDAGNLFTIDNSGDFGDRPRLVQVVPGGDSGWRMTFFDVPNRGPFGRERLWELPHDGQPAWIVPPLAHIGDGPAGLDHYPGTGLPAHFEGRFLVADFTGSDATSSIRSFRIRPSAAAYEIWAEEQTFRHVLATDVKFGPDGAIWVANWVAPQPAGARGRIWRFAPTASPEAAELTRISAEVRRLLERQWSAVDADELVGLLGHADGRVRREAQWELARRGDLERLSAARTAAAPLARRHAGWGLEQVGRRSDDTVRRAAAEALAALVVDEAWETRMVACRCLGDLADRESISALLPALDDPQPHVRAAAAVALGRIGDERATQPLLASLRRAAAAGPLDPHLRHALVMGLAGAGDAACGERLADDEDPQVRLVACLVLRRRADPRIAACLRDSDRRVVVEAARAIYDVPIASAAGALIASLADGPADGPDGDAFLRRGISAAEREGSSEAAQRLAGCAARRDVPTERRLEALAALAAWPAPAPRDRVLAAWRPVVPRDASAARDAVTAALPEILAATESAPEVTAAALATAAVLGCPDVAGVLAAAAVGGEASRRAAALKCLAEIAASAALAVARELAAAPEQPVRQASRRVRATHGPAAEIVPELAAVAADAAAARGERQQAIDLLAGIDDTAAVAAIALLAASLENGTLDPSLELETLEAVDRQIDAGAAQRLRTLREPAAGLPPGWHDVAWGGDTDRGRRVFFDSAAVGCVRCHRAEGRGGAAGPQLDGLAGGRDRGHLVESIVTPDARFTDGYSTVVVGTSDGRAVQGVVEADDATALVIRSADGSVHRLAADEIEGRTAGPSAMPGNLVTKLTRRELRDLIEWLSTLEDQPSAPR